MSLTTLPPSLDGQITLSGSWHQLQENFQCLTDLTCLPLLMPILQSLVHLALNALLYGHKGISHSLKQGNTFLKVVLLYTSDTGGILIHNSSAHPAYRKRGK